MLQKNNLPFMISSLTFTLLLIHSLSSQAKHEETYWLPSENVKIYNLVVDYIPSSDDSRPIGLYFKNELPPQLKFPGPTLVFKQGQTAVVRVYNRLSEETSIHWHGIILPNEQDGVPHITSKSIPAFNPNNPEQYFEYRFKVVQSGTYWYHSHSAFQEQRGFYGPIVILPPDSNSATNPTLDSHDRIHGSSTNHNDTHNRISMGSNSLISYNYDRVIDFSDYVRRDPEKVMAVLKSDNERESRQKKTERSLYDDYREGTLRERFNCEALGMGPMDIADVAIDSILANGRKEQYLNTKIGVSEKVRLRLINSSASSFIQVMYGKKRKMTIIAADGLDVSPYDTEYLIMGVGETYDVIVESDPKQKVELRGTVFEINPRLFSSTLIGPKEVTSKELAPNLPKLNPCVHQSGELVYNQIRSTKTVHDKWAWKENSPIKEFQLTLTGDMRANRYVWSMDSSKVFADTEPLAIKKGDHVRIKLTNNTMMFHPIHLHGHFFAIRDVGPSLMMNHMGHNMGHMGHMGNMQHDMNMHGMGMNHESMQGQEHHHGQNEAPVLWKHTMIMGPYTEQIIEFYATEERNWLFHCHNLYHMTAGMSIMFSYISDAAAAPSGSATAATNTATTNGHMNHMNHSMNDSSGSANSLQDARKLVNAHPEMGGNRGGYVNYDISFNTNQTEGTAGVSLNDKIDAMFTGKYAYADGDFRERVDLDYHPKQDSYSPYQERYLGYYVAVENRKAGHEKGVYGAAGINFEIFSLNGRLGWGSKGIDTCIARDIPLAGDLFLYGKYCHQGRTNYYDARLGYHVFKDEGNRQINLDGHFGVNEDGVMAGVTVHGGTVTPSRLFDNIMKKDH